MKNIRINKNTHSALKIDMGLHFDLQSLQIFYLKWKRLDSSWLPLDFKVRKNMQVAGQYLI